MHPRPLQNTDPAAILDRLQLGPGMTVAALEAGELASAIARKATVYTDAAEVRDHSCDLVLLAGETDPAMLDQARRMLKDGGRLAIFGREAPLREVVFILEQSAWTLHHQGPAGPGAYLLIATPTDESVQS